MKRSADTHESLVYAYGCGQPISGVEHLRDEHLRQRAMWDALVMADRRAERAQWDAARTDPAIDALVIEIDRLTAAIEVAVKARRAERAKARAKVDTPDLDATIAELADQRRACNRELWPLLKTWRKDNKDIVIAVERERYAENKAIRHQSGLWWCNYERVGDSFERGRLTAKKRGGQMRLSDPARTDGVLTVRIQATKTGRGATIDEIMRGAVNALRITPVDLVQPTRADRRRASHTTLDMRIDAAGHRLVIPLVLHRLPPPEARIKSAQLTWRIEGERLRYQLALTLSQPAISRAHPSPMACGVDLGWRLQPDQSLLVATVTDGRAIERITLPAEWMAGMDQVERLQAHLDDNAIEIARAYHETIEHLDDDLRAPLMGWRPRLGAGHVNVERLASAVRARIEAVKGTQARADVPADIRHWYDRYRHLSLWRDNLRAKLQRQRRELYRLAARRIAQGYALIGIEDFDLSEVAKTKQRAPETGDNPLHAAARANRQRACVHLFRDELKHQARKHGAELAIIKGATTRHCHACGHLNKGPADRADRVWVCEGCGATWDQDINAAQNLLDAATGNSPVLKRAA